MDALFTLEGKRILVTGASSGIGRACAVMASQMGAIVYLVARRAEALEETRSLMRNPDLHRVCACDVSDWGAVLKLITDVANEDKIDGLVHAAGIGPVTPIRMLCQEDAQKVMNVNYLSFVALMRECSKRKFTNDGFSAVAISSVAALVGTPGQAAYSGSKGALCSFVRTMAMELVSRKIRVNAVCPSNIKTKMLDDVLGELNSEAALQKILEKQPLGIGTPEQVAAPVCFLLSDAASFITGVNLPVDGGALAQ